MVNKKINKYLSVVVVCYKDEGNIRALYGRLSKSLKKITKKYEIIYVNDASPDRSGNILETLARKDKKLTVIHHSRNFGAQAAFTSGMEQAIGDAVIIMDGDLQDPPELIEKFVKKWLLGFQVVYGIRKKREKSMGKIKSWIYHMFYVIFNKFSYMQVPLDVGEFSLMDREVVDYINSMPERDRLIRGLRAWVGFRNAGVPYMRPERYWGKSTNNLISGTKWARKAIFSFSYAPIEFISRLAFFVVIIAFSALIFYFASAILDPTRPKGIATVIILTLFLGGIQLLSLGIIGEYIGRIFEETKQRPRYIVRKIINNHKK